MTDTINHAAQWRSEIRATLTLAWPLVLTNLAQMAMTTTDVMILGWLGPESLAAGGLGANLYIALVIFGIGVVTAVSPMLARTLGENRYAVREVRRTVRQGLWVSVALALPIWLVLWQTGPILRAMGQDPALAAAAEIYVRVMMFGALPFFGYLVLRFFMAALERPGAALAVTGLAVAFNALANWVLVFGHFGFPALGIFGSGLATALSNLLLFGGLAAVVSVDRRFARYRLFGRFWRADWLRFRHILRLGLPIGATLAFEVTIFNAAVFLMGLIGTAALAAHMIAIQIASFTFMIPLGFSQAATVRIGLAQGAGDAHGVTRAGWCAFGLVMGVMLVTAATMILTPLLPIRAFIDVHAPDNAEVVRLAIAFLLVAGIFQIVDGAQAIGAGMLRGLHDTRIPMLFAALGYWGIGLPLGAILAFKAQMGGVGIWIGLATGLAIVAALMLTRWMQRERLGLLAEAAN